MKNIGGLVFLCIVCFYASAALAALWWSWLQFFLGVFDEIEF